MGCLIQEVQVGSTVRCQFFSFMDRLSASTYTSAWTCHDFYKMIVYFSLLDRFHQISCILKSTHNCDIYRIASNLKLGFCPSVFVHSTNLFKCIYFCILSCDQLIRRTQCRFHNSASCPKDHSCSGSLSKRSIKGSIF